MEQADLASKQNLEDAAAFKEAKWVIGWVDSTSVSSLAKGELSRPLPCLLAPPLSEKKRVIVQL